MVYDVPMQSNVEAKLRRFLVESGNAGCIIGIQVYADKDMEVIIDTATGILGKDDPHPVQPDTLFPCFLVTKGVIVATVHWLVDQGLRHREQKDELSPRRVYLFTKHNIVPPCAVVSAGIANSTIKGKSSNTYMGAYF